MGAAATGGPTREVVLQALGQVQDPDLRRDIVSLGFVKRADVTGGAVEVEIELTTPACPVKDRLRDEARERVAALPGVTTVSVVMTAVVRGRAGDPSPLLREVQHVVAVGSGKGGVGKSTTSVNLAYALAASGARVGLLDADVYGPSLPTLLGIHDYPQITEENGMQRIVPLEHRGVKVMSLGFLATEETPIIWRGPMASKLIQQFLGGVEWGALDYLIIDLPPGTGDVQLTLTQSAPLTGAVIVTTPQDVALTIAQKGLKMFEKVNVTVLGIVENMSGFVCGHCGQVTPIFGSGGGVKMQERHGAPLLGRVPLDPEVVEGGDRGLPIVLKSPASPAAAAFREIAGRLAAQISIVTHQTASTTCWPTETVRAPDGRTVQMAWSDGHRGPVPARALRVACPCAACVDEVTGVRRVTEAQISPEITIAEVHPVGRYALNFLFSDGHGSGLYPFKMVRERCGCPECLKARVPVKA